MYKNIAQLQGQGHVIKDLNLALGQSGANLTNVKIQESSDLDLDSFTNAARQVVLAFYYTALGITSKVGGSPIFLQLHPG